MENILKKKTIKKNELGASLVEYGLLVALIGIIAIPSVKSVGKSTNCIFEVASVGLTAASAGLPFDPVLAKADCNSAGPS